MTAVTDKHQLAQAIAKSYGKENTVGDLMNFQGHYINFGYWKDIMLNDSSEIKLTDRVKSSVHLYELVIRQLAIRNIDIILEIGCGKGIGAIATAIKYSPKDFFAIDMMPEQIARAKELQSEFGVNIDFEVGEDTNTHLPDDTVDKVFSVEAAQHFFSIKSFADEMHRILRTNGQLVFAAHFTTSQDGYDAMLQEGLFVKEGIDNVIPIEEVVNQLQSSGFTKIKTKTIGDYVFPGFHRWILQIQNQAPPGAKNLYQSYVKGYLNYYLVEAFLP